MSRLAFLLRAARGRGAAVLAAAVVLASSAGNVTAADRHLAFGDSITEGFGDETEKGGYPTRLRKLLRKVDPETDVLNFGVGGERTPAGLSRIEAVLKTGGDTILIMEGTNDVRGIARGELSLETTIANLELMGNKAKSRDIEPIHATIISTLPTATVDSDAVLTEELTFMIREMASKKGRRLVDAWEAFDPDNDPDVFKTLYTSAEKKIGHPNLDGYNRLAETFADVLLGVDAVPPVIGDWTPGLRPNVIPPDFEIVVPVYEPKESAGLDIASTYMMINGVEVARADGNRRKAEMTYSDPEGIGCKAIIQIVAEDRNDPPNVLDKRLGSFNIEDRALLDGDIDFDCLVDAFDLVTLARALGSEEGEERFNPAVDINRDGKIGKRDLNKLRSNFGRDSS